MVDITEDLRKLRELLSKSSPMPWRSGILHPQPNVRTRTPDGGWACGPFCRTSEQAHRDAALIAAAVNALPGLLDECERLQKDAARYQRLALLVEVGVWSVMSDAAGQCDDQDRMNYLLDHPDTIREADEWAAAIASRAAMQEQQR